MKKLLSLITAFILIIVFACPINVQAATVKLNKEKATMEVDSSLKLKLGTIDTAKVSWKSSNTKIAAITKTGTITAKKEGSATITATYQSKKYTCNVTVVDSNKANTFTPTPVPAKEVSYKSGSYKIGNDMPAGEYVLFADNDIGYFSINSDSTGKLSSIIANDNFSYCSIITVSKGQYLDLSRCKAVPIDKATVSTDGEGMFKVGVHIKAGEYKIEATGNYAYVCVYNTSDHKLGSIITNDNFEGSKYITVEEGNYLYLSRCKLIK